MWRSLYQRRKVCINIYPIHLIAFTRLNVLAYLSAQPLTLGAIETQLSLFSHDLGDLAPAVFLDTVHLHSSNAHINVKVNATHPLPYFHSIRPVSYIACPSPYQLDPSTPRRATQPSTGRSTSLTSSP